LALWIASSTAAATLLLSAETISQALGPSDPRISIADTGRVTASALLVANVPVSTEPVESPTQLGSGRDLFRLASAPNTQPEASSAEPTTPTFSLKGIVADGRDFAAIIQGSGGDGSYRTVRAGDVLADNVVLRVEEDRMVLVPRRGGGTSEVRLRGAGEAP